MYLAMLLEKSSPLSNTDEHYQKILPPDLATLRIPHEAVEEITGTLCAEISRNPDAAFIAAISTTGMDKVTKYITELLIKPPRPLAISECAQALGIVQAYLPSCLTRDALFLSAKQRTQLAEKLQDLANAEDSLVKRDASALLKRLTSLGCT